MACASCVDTWVIRGIFSVMITIRVTFNLKSKCLINAHFVNHSKSSFDVVLAIPSRAFSVSTVSWYKSKFGSRVIRQTKDQTRCSASRRLWGLPKPMPFHSYVMYDSIFDFQNNIGKKRTSKRTLCARRCPLIWVGKRKSRGENARPLYKGYLRAATEDVSSWFQLSSTACRVWSSMLSNCFSLFFNSSASHWSVPGKSILPWIIEM